MFHYLHMARGNFRTYLQGEQVKIKKYFYVLRPILACEWIEQFGEMPPMGFDELVERLLPRGDALWQEVQHLLERKKSGEELDYEPRQEAIHAYIAEELETLEQRAHALKAAEMPIDEQLDCLFLETLQEVWGLVLPK
jgi:predicted nucleotidyltransferase